MSLSQLLFADLEHEFAGTRKTLERVPDDKWDWKIHEKSLTIGSLATHLGRIPSWTMFTFDRESLDLNPADGPNFNPPTPSNCAENLKIFDENVAQAVATLQTVDDATLDQPWTLLSGGETIFTIPKRMVIRTWVINHLIHHRAILTVYFRMNDIPVPALYGPSGDEQF
ncbi:damage-inducible protein DinB [Blastopirellula marina]|uniref:Damage-inducible protein DinB n=1 Tax=Blastopirellula marina TaxID=124 RepID=A0A2S8F5H7_9BACT|nr:MULTISPECIES: DinB family protein [Pirellulaceae]PQO27370.1 damage-inducible protein DinB [Blastopirellula marina]RCS47907.1 DinB family protein [Bremerella cremea]